MDRVTYQNLRFTVENQVADLSHGDIDPAAVVNSIMRCFLQVMAASQVKQASGKRAFRTFRRDVKCTPPGWAYRKPGTSSRLPKL